MPDKSVTTNDPVEIALRTYNMIRDGILLLSTGMGFLIVCVGAIAIKVLHG